MAKGQKKGGPGGGGNGSVEDLIRFGTNAADSLRGGKGNDTLYGLSGNDSLNGGDGTDTAVFAGSVLDFDWQVGKRGKVSITDLNPADGDEGSDTLTSIEVLQFDDYTYYLDGRANEPLVVVEDEYVTSVDTPITFTVLTYDIDHSYKDYGEISITGGSRLYARNHTRLDPAMGDAQSVEYTIDPNYADYSYLAAGETITETFSINYWGYTKTIDLVMTGLNDAPELDDGILAASEDGPLVSLDLAGLGSDIDSDDDGASLTYSIIDAPAGANVYLVGTELFFDPRSGYQNLNDGDVQELVVSVQATDRHGAVSAVQDVVIQISGQDDARPDYLNADMSINYGALGINLADYPVAGRISGVSVDDQVANLALAQFSGGDDVRVYSAAIFEIFGDYDFYYSYYGTDLYDDLTLNSGVGNDTLVFYQPSEAELAYLGLTDIVTDSGEDVVVIDVVALTPGIGASAWMEGVNISTGDDNDQVLISLTGASSQIIEGGDFVLGGGNDFMSIVMNSGSESEAGFSAIVMSDFYLGSGNDELLIDINGKDAVWAHVKADINAGDGDDHVSIDNSDVTMLQTYPYQGFMQRGLDGDIYMGAGDDTLDLNISALVQEAAEALLIGGQGHDVLNLLHGGFNDFAIEQQAYEGYYTITADGQTFSVNGFEEINTIDGSLFDLLI